MKFSLENSSDKKVHLKLCGKGGAGLIKTKFSISVQFVSDITNAFQGFYAEFYYDGNFSFLKVTQKVMTSSLVKPV